MHHVGSNRAARGIKAFGALYRRRVATPVSGYDSLPVDAGYMGNTLAFSAPRQDNGQDNPAVSRGSLAAPLVALLRRLKTSPKQAMQDHLAAQYPTITDEFHRLIESLVRLATVNSVQCPLLDRETWVILTKEQQRRARKTGLPLEEALFLSGPDSGMWPVNYIEMGGEVHVPYEGAPAADLFILPHWFNFAAERAQGPGSLRRALWGKQCHFVLSGQDFGELSSAYRTKFGGWILYESRQPYLPARSKTTHPDDEGIRGKGP